MYDLRSEDAFNMVLSHIKSIFFHINYIKRGDASLSFVLKNS